MHGFFLSIKSVCTNGVSLNKYCGTDFTVAEEFILNFLSVCRGRILGGNPDKSLKVFHLVIHSHLYSFALRFIFL
jgi:hypothetical protein